MRRIAPVLVLFFLAPMIAELLTSSTPLRLYFTPFFFVVNMGLYGAGSVLIRELARRRGLGWPRILLLGAAYAIIEEGLELQTFFISDPAKLGNLAVYGRAIGVNWVWAEALILFHAVFSITIPILLVEMLFTARRAGCWLGKRGLRVVGAIFGLDVVVGSILFTLFLHTQHKDYLPPILPYLGAIAAVYLLVRLALRPAQRAARPAVIPFVPRSTRQPPGLWALRLLGFGVMICFYLIVFVLTNDKSRIPAPIPMLLLALLAYSLYRLVRHWSGPRWSWDDRHRLALATGGLLFYLILGDLLFAPLALHLPEQILVGLVATLLLALFAWRINRRAEQVVAAAHLPTEYLSPRQSTPPAVQPTYYTPPDQPTVVFPDDSLPPPTSYPPDAPTIHLNRP